MWEIVTRAQVRSGQYDWLELRRSYAVLIKAGDAGVYSWDLDEGTNRLSFEFATPAELEAFRKRAESPGVPAAVMILKVDGGVRWPVR